MVSLAILLATSDRNQTDSTRLTRAICSDDHHAFREPSPIFSMPRFVPHLHDPTGRASLERGAWYKSRRRRTALPAVHEAYGGLGLDFASMPAREELAYLGGRRLHLHRHRRRLPRPFASGRSAPPPRHGHGGPSRHRHDRARSGATCSPRPLRRDGWLPAVGSKTYLTTARRHLSSSRRARRGGRGARLPCSSSRRGTVHRRRNLDKTGFTQRQS